MARILYGVAGEGFGHSSRSELLGRRLMESGHEVLFAASGKSLQYLGRCFPDQVAEVYGLSFALRNGRVDPLATAWQNVCNYRRGFQVNRRLFRRQIRSFHPDLVVSDFEPFSAWWAWRNRIPCISIDNEHLLTLGELDPIPGHRKDRLLARSVIRSYHAREDAYVILNFFRVPLKSPRAVLAVPVVRDIVQNAEPWSGDHIVCYSTYAGPDMRRRFTEVLRQFPRQQFFVYGFDQNLEEANIRFRKTSTEHFIHDLAGARGAAATAGFSLISECLHFRKRMLLTPVAGQYEQIINAHYVEKTGLGLESPQLSVEAVARFLDLLETPFEPGEDVLLPDNERYFETVEAAFRKVGLPIGLKKGGQDRAS